MWALHLFFAGVSLSGVVIELLLPEERASQLRLFGNAVFCGGNAYFAWLQF